MDEDCLSYGKPTSCLCLPRLQLKPPNYSHAEEDRGSTGNRSRCPTVSWQPPPAPESILGGQKGKREGKESTSLDSSKRKSLSHLPGSLQNIFTILTPSCPDGTATETPNYGGEFASRTRKSFNFTQATDSNGVSFGSQGSAAWWTDTTPRPYTHSNSEVSQGLGLIHNLQPALHSQRDHRNPT